MTTEYSDYKLDPPNEQEPVECVACCGKGKRIDWRGMIEECPHCIGQGVLEPESAETLREIRADERRAEREGK
jgi:DnaJ-class molecular chaperone